MGVTNLLNEETLGGGGTFSVKKQLGGGGQTFSVKKQGG